MRLTDFHARQLAGHFHAYGWSSPKAIGQAKMAVEFLNSAHPETLVERWLASHQAVIAIEAARRSMTEDEFLAAILDDVFAVYQAETDEDL